MPLPKVVTPTYELKLLSTGKTCKYRPFLVKEEKVLLLALEDGDSKTISTAINKVLKNCIMTRGVRIENLPSFDIEYLFLNIRGKSVGETVELNVVCEDDGKTQVPLTVDVGDIKLVVPDEHNEDVDLGSGLHIKLKYPSMQEFLNTNFNVTENKGDTIDTAFKSVAKCIDTIYNEEEAWSSTDYSERELVDFIEQLDSSQFAKVEKFFATMPKLQYKTTVVNPNTKVENEIVIEGLSSFFA